MSILNSVTHSQRSNRSEYRRVLKKITGVFRHQEINKRDIDESISIADEDNYYDIPEDNEEMKEYVRNFRIKVSKS